MRNNSSISLSIRLIFFCFFVSHSIPLFSQTSIASNIERLLPSANGDSFRVIHCITQDKQGFIWIASPYGLARYDGIDYTLFKHEIGNPSSLIDNHLFSVLEDSRGDLWITSDKGLDLFNRETGQFIHFQHDPNDPNSLSSNHIRAICEDKAGYLWIGTKDAGVNRFDSRNKTFTRFPHDPININSPSSNSIWAIYCDQKGNIWIGNSGVNKLDSYDPKHRTWSHYTWLPNDMEELKNPHIWALCEEHNGYIWIGTNQSGLGCLDPESGIFSFINLKKDSGSYLKDYEILALHQDQDGILWIGTNEAGIFCYHPDDNSIECYPNNLVNKRSPSRESISCIFEDREGLLWFGTGNGISVINIRRLQFELVQSDSDIKEGLSDNEILTLFEDKEGIIWIGTAYGGLNCWDRKNSLWKQTIFPKYWVDYFIENPVRSICEDDSGDLWIGTSKGLVHYITRSNSFTLYTKELKGKAILHSYNINAICPGREGFLWIGSSKGDLIQWDIKNKMGTPIPYLQREARYDYKINTLFVDSLGSVWIGTQWHGAYCLNPISLHCTHFPNNLNNQNSLPNSTVYSFAEDKNRNIWVGTEAGICYINHSEQQCNQFPNMNSLPDNSAYGLLFDDMDNLWVSSNKGLIKITDQNHMISTYGPEDGIQSENFNPGACFKSNTGELYFGGNSGFNHFFPNEITTNPFMPSVIVTSYKLSTQSEEKIVYNKLDVLEVTKKDLPLIINLATCSFTNPHKIKYRVRIPNSDNVELILDNQNSVQLRKLQPGRNRLLIQASNHNQQWNEEEVPLTIILNTPFWQSSVFRYSLIILFVSIFGYWFQIRHRNHQEQSQVIHEDLTPLLRKKKITKREREVLELVIKGKTNKEIERELFISYQTVKTHLYNIYQKIGVNSRLQLMNTVLGYLKKTNSKA